MPKYRVMKSHVHAPGGVYANVGDIIELSKDEATQRVAIGFVEGPVIDPPPPPPAAVAAAPEDAKKK